MPSSLIPQARPTIAEVLAGFDDLVAQNFLKRTEIGSFHSHGRLYAIPKFYFGAAASETDAIHLGIFATLHGDEPEAALALPRWCRELAAQPSLAEGYALHIYPICNPTGLETACRHSRRGADLNRFFWKSSEEPEVRLIEEELHRHPFQGLISLHSDDQVSGVYGFVQGPVLSAGLLEPALRAASTVLPRNADPVIDQFPAKDGIIYQGYPGILSAPRHPNQPFEIVFETPQREPLDRQMAAIQLALNAVLHEYRSFISISQNL